ncbi:hypothetical protein [Thaumasiovibrio sp. DFM-14]|uniref:hypothetical protein n=1 Tax=Thaumasiovibrio sp. DFM-14 TaxID=3384792 RepID=UPI0039A37FF6
MFAINAGAMVPVWLRYTRHLGAVDGSLPREYFIGETDPATYIYEQCYAETLSAMARKK